MTAREAMLDNTFSLFIDRLKDKYSLDRITVIESPNPIASTNHVMLQMQYRDKYLRYMIDPEIELSELESKLDYCISNNFGLVSFKRDLDNTISSINSVELKFDNSINSINNTLNQLQEEVYRTRALALDKNAMDLMYRELIKNLIDPEGTEWKVYIEEDTHRIILESSRGKFQLDRSKFVDLFISTEVFKAID